MSRDYLNSNLDNSRYERYGALKDGSFDSLEVTWDACPAADWDRHLATAGLSSLEQSWPYGEALAALEACRLHRALVTRAGRAVAR